MDETKSSRSATTSPPVESALSTRATPAEPTITASAPEAATAATSARVRTPKPTAIGAEVRPRSAAMVLASSGPPVVAAVPLRP